MLKNIDFLGHPIGLEINQNKVYKTYTGAFISIIVIAASIALSFLSVKELWERKTPNVALSKEFLSIQNSTVNILDLGITIVMLDNNENFIPYLDDLIEMEIHQIEVTVEGAKTKKLDSSVGLKRLLDNNYLLGKYENITTVHEYYSLFKQIVFGLEFTPPEDNSITRSDFEVRSGASSVGSQWIEIHIGICNVGKRKNNLNMVQCRPDSIEMFKELYLTFSYTKPYVRNDIYDEPIQYKVQPAAMKFADGFNKRTTFTSSNSKLVADNGWLFEEKIIYDYIDVSTIVDLDLTATSTGIGYGNIIARFDTNVVVDSYARSYLKVINVLANIGGLVNTLLLISKLLFSHYFRFVFNSYVSTQLIDFEKNIESKNSTNKNEIDYNNFNSVNRNNNNNNVSDINKIIINSTNLVTDNNNNNNMLSVNKNINEINNNQNNNSNVINNNSNSNNNIISKANIDITIKQSLNKFFLDTTKVYSKENFIKKPNYFSYLLEILFFKKNDKAKNKQYLKEAIERLDLKEVLFYYSIKNIKSKIMNEDMILK